VSDVRCDWKLALKVQLGGKWSRREVWWGGYIHMDIERDGQIFDGTPTFLFHCCFLLGCTIPNILFIYLQVME
jgi:hypothetical protein